MIYVLVVSVFVLAFFIAFIVFGIKLIIILSKKDKPSVGLIIKTILSGFFWALLGCINLFLVINAMNNEDPIIERILNSGADTTSKVMVYTFENIEKNWNKDILKKANKISFDIISLEKNDSKDIKKDVYKINLLLTNNNGKGKPISSWDLVSQNILFGLDKNDVFQSVQVTDQTAESIPTGKSYLGIKIEVPKYTQLKQIGLGDNKKNLDMK
jgi:hypothetical protein